MLLENKNENKQMDTENKNETEITIENEVVEVVASIEEALEVENNKEVPASTEGTTVKITGTNVEVVEAIQLDLKALREELEATKAELTEANNKLSIIDGEKLEAEKKTEVNKVAEMVTNLFTEGKIGEEEKVSMLNMGLTEVKMISNLLANKLTNSVNLLEAVSSKVDGVKDINNKATWTMRDYEKKDPAGLKVIHDTNPELYNKMFDDEYKSK